MRVLVLFDLHRPPRPDEAFSAEGLRRREGKPTEADVLLALGRLGHQATPLALHDRLAPLVAAVEAGAPDVVFNLAEAFRCERAHEPHLPALLALLGVPYTGAAPESLMLCKDKLLAKRLLAAAGISVPRCLVSPGRRPLRRAGRLVYPAFVKPIGEEGSDGISQASLVRDERELLARVAFLHERFAGDVLVEEYIDGRELYLGGLGRRGRRPTLFGPRELFFGSPAKGAAPIASQKAKWDEAYRQRRGIRTGAAAPLPAGTAAQLARLAAVAFDLLRLSGPARLDLRLRADGEPVFLEANPNPSLAADEDFAAAALASGLGYDALVARLLREARRAAGARRRP